MLSATQLNLYLLAATLLVMAPGPDTLFVIARSVESGRKGGLLAALGICLGEFVHIGAATIGLSALLLSSAVAFAAVKMIGAAYLLYLGIKTLVAKAATTDTTEPVRREKILIQGFLTNALNPKVAVFFVAFVPQFADPKLGHFPLQIALLGFIHQGIGLVWLSLIGVLSGSLAHFSKGAGFRTFQKWFSGSILVALGGRLLTLQASTH